MAESDREFGRLLLKKRRGRALLLGALGLVPVGIILALSPLSDPTVRTLIGPGLAAAGVAYAIAGFVLRSRQVCLYERGIVDGSKRLAFSDVTELTAALTRIIFAGTSADYYFKIIGNSNAGPTTIRFWSGKLGDNFLSAYTIIAPISTALEVRMKASLDRGESIRWGRRGSIQNGAVQFGDKPSMKLTEITTFALWNGELTINTADGRKARLKSSEPNFFPGYAIVCGMLGVPARALN